MSKKAVLYARVSSEDQTKGDAVSIDSQLADMRQLCERNGLQIHSTFIDCTNYRATHQPKKGKMVSPSGERVDRPGFLEMLEVVKVGAVDVVLCWRDDRLMRHPRVAVVLEDSLDVGDVMGKRKIKILDATGATIDRFTLSIKAVIWREENKRRAERIKMGKVGTLQKGRWPGKYDRLGYSSRKEKGQRGRIIELGEPTEVQTVKDIFNWYDQGLTIRQIRKRLIKRGDWQTDRPRMYEWNPVIIGNILRAKEYTGVATWNFKEEPMSIKIPPIISHEQWERVQKRLTKNRALASRNASRVFILHHLTVCGECGGKISPQLQHFYHGKLASGKTKKYTYKSPRFYYRCVKATRFNTEHRSPSHWKGHNLEWAVWRYLVDNGIKKPNLIVNQVQARQQNLIEQGESVSGDIAKARIKLTETEQQRAFFQRQAARGKISEHEFDRHMDETQEDLYYWQGEIEHLQELRDDAVKVRAGVDYTVRLLQSFESKLDEVDLNPSELETLPKAQQEKILKDRQKIVRALCEKITIYSTGRIVIDGLLDGSEFSQFEVRCLKT